MKSAIFVLGAILVIAGGTLWIDTARAAGMAVLLLGLGTGLAGLLALGCKHCDEMADR
jgi:hypothetical protein